MFVGVEGMVAYRDACGNRVRGNPDTAYDKERYVQSEKITRLEVALEFYRDAWDFKTNKRYGGLEWSPKEELLDDCGNVARAALEDKA